MLGHLLHVAAGSQTHCHCSHRWWKLLFRSYVSRSPSWSVGSPHPALTAGKQPPGMVLAQRWQLQLPLQPQSLPPPLPGAPAGWGCQGRRGRRPPAPGSAAGALAGTAAQQATDTEGDTSEKATHLQRSTCIYLQIN